MRALIVLTLFAACGDDAMTGPDASSTGDGPMADARPDAPMVDTSGVPAGCTTTRTMGDRADDSSLDQIRILYVIPSDGQDRNLDTNGQICNSARAFAT